MATVPIAPLPTPGEDDSRRVAPGAASSRFATVPLRGQARGTLATQIVEYAPDCMLALEADTLRITVANRAARQLYRRISGLDGASLLGQTIDHLLPWLDERGILAQVHIVAETGEAMHGLPFELERVPGYEGPRYWSYDIVPLGEPSQPAAELLIALSDRTEERIERQRAERAAFSAQLYAEKLEAVIEQITEAVMIRDQSGQLLAYNRAALSFAANRGEVERARARGTRLEPDWALCFADGSPVPEIEHPAWRAMLTGAPIMGSQLLVRREDGAETPVLVHAAPLRDEAGTITSAVVAFQDISAVKEIERLKDEFISVASHELRQPLTVIQGHAQMLKRQLRRLASGAGASALDPEKLRQLAEGVEAQTGRLNLLVSDLLDMSRIQAGQLQLEPLPTRLLPMVTHLVEVQRSSTLDHTFRLVVEEQPDMPELEGLWDSRRVEQILLNLLSNAVKYSPTGGEVTVAVSVLPGGHSVEQWLPGRPRRVAGPAAQVTIRDQGIGIPEDALQHLFERFYRARNTSGIQGTGLGLYICRQLAWAHQGDLWVESHGIGSGSTFHLTLPLIASRG